jgi:hypothetical protein
MSLVGREVKRREKGSARGQATVELALIFLFLALLLIGVADVARIYSEHLTVVQAAGVGARWYVLDPDHKGCSGYVDVEEVVRDAIGGAIPSGDIKDVQTVLVANGAAVRVTYTHRYLFGLINNVPSEFTGQATMPGQPDTAVGVCPPTPMPSTGTPTATPGSPLPTNTATLTRTPTHTPTPTATPTPQCPVAVSNPQFTKKPGNNLIKVQLRLRYSSGSGGPVSGASVVARVPRPSGDLVFQLSETTTPGVYCGLSLDDVPGGTRTVIVTYTDAVCGQGTYTQDTDNSGNLTCPP